MASVSCMGHLTSRFGKVSPQGKVMGWDSSSMAVGLDESSTMVGAKGVYFYCTGARNSNRFRRVSSQREIGDICK